MSPAQHARACAWAALLSAVVCLVVSCQHPTGFHSRPAGGTGTHHSVLGCRLPSRAARFHPVSGGPALKPIIVSPVVLVCGDLPLAWPHQSPVLTVTQGCWIRVEGIIGTGAGRPSGTVVAPRRGTSAVSDGQWLSQQHPDT